MAVIYSSPKGGGLRIEPSACHWREFLSAAHVCGWWPASNEKSSQNIYLSRIISSPFCVCYCCSLLYTFIFFHFPWLTGGHVVSLFQDAVMTCYYVLQRKCCPHTGLMNIQRLELVEPRPQQPKRCFSSNNADGINDQVRLQRHIATVSSPFVTRRQVNTRISVGHYVKTLRFLTWIFFWCFLFF